MRLREIHRTGEVAEVFFADAKTGAALTWTDPRTGRTEERPFTVSVADYNAGKRAEVVDPVLFPSGGEWAWRWARRRFTYNTASTDPEPGCIWIEDGEIRVQITENGELILRESEHRVARGPNGGITLTPDPPGYSIVDGELNGSV